MSTSTNAIEALANQEYKYGFVTEVEADTIPRGLNEDVVHHARSLNFPIGFRIERHAAC
jgi:hypothetical protein